MSDDLSGMPSVPSASSSYSQQPLHTQQLSGAPSQATSPSAFTHSAYDQLNPLKTEGDPNANPNSNDLLMQSQMAAQLMASAMQQPQQQSVEPMSQIQCIYCSTQLSYPSSSLYIQCPKCSNTMNPSAPQISYVTCICCATLLSHPPSSLTIQCPKCMTIMDLPVRMNQSGSNTPGAESSEPNRKVKKKDPNAPKRASNAYMIFCKEQRSALKDKHPDLPFGKIGAKLGEIWRQMSADEKKPYEARAAGDRDRYKREMSTYTGPAKPANSTSPQLSGLSGLNGMAGIGQFSALNASALGNLDPIAAGDTNKKRKAEDGSAWGNAQLDMSAMQQYQQQMLLQQQYAAYANMQPGMLSGHGMMHPSMMTAQNGQIMTQAAAGMMAAMGGQGQATMNPIITQTTQGGVAGVTQTQGAGMTQLHPDYSALQTPGTSVSGSTQLSSTSDSANFSNQPPVMSGGAEHDDDDDEDEEDEEDGE